MEPVTHFLTGACLARSGLNRKSAYVTLAMTLAAEAPDLDVLWSMTGPTAALEFHRGWTHTLLGAPVMATATCGVVWLWHKWRSRKGAAKIAAPLRWGWLWGCALLASLSHIFLDYTNNYGVRPFAPFNPRWYEGSFVFIFEPLIFAALLAALVMPWLFGLADREIGVKKNLFPGRNWAIAMLAFIVLLWGYRAVEHHRAANDLMQHEWPGEVLRVSANPYPITPWKWHGVVETSTAYIAATVDTRTDTVTSDAVSDTFYKSAVTPAMAAAKQSHFGRVYLDWSQLPYVDEIGRMPLPGQPGVMATAVRFRDLRFNYGLAAQMAEQRDGSPPLSAIVYVDDKLRVVLVQMNGREETP